MFVSDGHLAWVVQAGITYDGGARVHWRVPEAHIAEGLPTSRANGGSEAVEGAAVLEVEDVVAVAFVTMLADTLIYYSF